jgi:hypothetical protein
LPSEAKARMLQLHEQNVLLTEQAKAMETKLLSAKRVGPDGDQGGQRKLIRKCVAAQLLKEQDELIRKGRNVNAHA